MTQHQGTFLRICLLVVCSVVVAADTVTVGSSTLNIAPLGSPRLLVSDTTTLTRLKSAASSNTAAYARFKAACDYQVAHPGYYYAFEDWNIALLYRILDQSSYCTFAVASQDAFVASEEVLINAGQVPEVAGDDYLDIGGYIGGIMSIYDWCRPQMNDTQRLRWMTYANLAVTNVWNQTYAKWGGVSHPGDNWAVNDPSDNYYYSFLRATMLLGLATYGENSQAQHWLEQFRVTKIQNQLVPEFLIQLSGGGSREGTGYGVAMKGLFDLYYWWEKSTGERIADLTPHTLASLDHFMHDIQPTFDYIGIVGDQSRESTGAFFDYHREYLLVASALYQSDIMAGTAKTLLQQSTVTSMQNAFEFWIDYLYSNDPITAQPLSLMSTSHWGNGTGQFTMRSSWTDTQATWSNFICGPYTQSHAHQDQLSFMIYKGALLASDETYDSHSGLRQEEDAHNLVRIYTSNTEIVMPVDSNQCVMKALIDTASYAYAFGDVTSMFQSSTILKLQREYVFIKPSTFVVFDRADTVGTTKRVWTLNTHTLPTVSDPNIVVTNTNKGTHTLKTVRLAPASANYTIVNWSTLHPDGDDLTGYRVDVTDLSTGSSSVFLNVMGIDNSFTSAVSSNIAGMTGTLITFADGSTALVRFNTTGTGGTIAFTNASGTTIESHPLPTTVVTPPRFSSTPSTTSTTTTTAAATTAKAATTTTTTAAATTTTAKATTTTTTAAATTTAKATTTTTTAASSTTGSATPTPTPTCHAAVIGTGVGLRGDYYTGNFTTIQAAKPDATINFNWVDAAPPISGFPVDNFSIRWSGTLLAKYTGVHTFIGNSDDGARLYINGIKVFEDWVDHTARDVNGTYSLVAGTSYPIVLEYHDTLHEASVALYWYYPPCLAKEIIPTSQLTPAPFKLC